MFVTVSLLPDVMPYYPKWPVNHAAWKMAGGVLQVFTIDGPARPEVSTSVDVGNDGMRRLGVQTLIVTNAAGVSQIKIWMVIIQLPAAQWVAGAALPLQNGWAVFGDYKGSFSRNHVRLDSGGTIDTHVLTNAITFGLTKRF